MSDFEAQISELLLQLTQDQQQAALDFLRLLTGEVQETNPAAPQTTSHKDD